MVTALRLPARARRWMLPLLIAGAAFALRLLLIHLYRDGRDDLRIYTWFGRILAGGGNPYLAPADGPVSPFYADMPMLDMALFATVLRLWESPTALRVLFAFFDMLVILTLGLGIKRPNSWRLHAMLFWAFNPMVLLAFVVFTVDKAIVLWMILLTVTAVEAGRAGGSLFWTTLLALYRWIGVFFVLPMVLHFHRTWRSRAFALGAFAGAILLSHIPFFPANLMLYVSKANRTRIDPPIHASPTSLLSALGLYAPWMVPVGIAAILALLYILYLRRRISLVEVIVLSTLLPVLLAPELPVGRILMVGFPMLLLVQMDATRWLILWGTSLIGAPFANGYETAAILNLLRIPSVIEHSSVPYVLLVNLITAALLAFYLLDKSRGLVDSATRLPEDGGFWPLWRATPAQRLRTEGAPLSAD